MNHPKIKTRVVHSKSKPAWNIVGDKLGGKYKIARVPYIAVADKEITEANKIEALEHAEFISYCFNNSDVIFREGSSRGWIDVPNPISKFKQRLAEMAAKRASEAGEQFKKQVVRAAKDNMRERTQAIIVELSEVKKDLMAGEYYHATGARIFPENIPGQRILRLQNEITENNKTQ